MQSIRHAKEHRLFPAVFLRSMTHRLLDAMRTFPGGANYFARVTK
jgi:hypothetical protein